MSHFQRILDTLASAAYGKNTPIPNPDEKVMKKRDENVWSNIMGVSVIMGWAREEVVRPLIGTQGWMALWSVLLFA